MLHAASRGGRDCHRRVANANGCAARSSSLRPLSRSCSWSARGCCCGASHAWRRSISVSSPLACRRSACRCRNQSTHTPASRAAFFETLLDRLATRTDVESAGAIFGLPLTNFRYVISMSTLDGRTLSDDDRRDGRCRCALSRRTTSGRWAFRSRMGARSRGAIGWARHTWSWSTKRRCDSSGAVRIRSAITSRWVRASARAANAPAEKSSASPGTSATTGRRSPCSRPSISRMRSSRWTS